MLTIQSLTSLGILVEELKKRRGIFVARLRSDGVKCLMICGSLFPTSGGYGQESASSGYQTN